MLRQSAGKKLRYESSRMKSMSIQERLKPAFRAAFKHLLGCVLIAGLTAWIVFGVWYPAPYGELAGGFTLFGIVVSVDVICGPLLTLVVFDRLKPKSELVRDISIIIVLQLSALVYGIYSVAQARPVFLAYEGNRFRVVSSADVNPADLSKAPLEFRSFSYTGPRLVGVQLSRPTDPDFKASVMLSMEGLHPSFRPERWVPYDTLLSNLQEAMQPLEKLASRYPEINEKIQKIMRSSGLGMDELGYLPLEAAKASSADWVIILDRKTGKPHGFFAVDGW